MRVRRWFGAVTVVVAVSVIAFAAGCSSPKVPDVIGMTQAEAVRALQVEGYLLGEITYVAVEGGDLGSVASQDPAAGAEADEGAAVSLAIAASDGARVLVPDVSDLDLVTADGVATTLGMIATPVEQYSPDVAEGKIAAQVPAPGSEVDAGSNLLLVVSKGVEPDRAKVPDVAGKKVVDAEKAVADAGFRAFTLSVFDADTPDGVVIGQLPKAGSSLVVDSKVNIIVSKGPGTAAAKVPTVKGKSEADAVDAIEAAGLKPRKLSRYDDEVAKGAVSYQFPVGGRTTARGSEVLISVSLGPVPSDAVTVPDVTGQSYLDATAALEAQGFDVQVELVNADGGEVVAYQFPAAGALTAAGSPVLLVIAPPPQPK